MESLQDQLKNVKLKKTKEKTKDFSSPKLAGELIALYILTLKYILSYHKYIDWKHLLLIQK